MKTITKPNTATSAMVVEAQEVERDYEFKGTQAIIDTKNGRLLIEDGYGGEDSLAGGCVRWKHGSVYELLPGDTFESMAAKFGTCCGEDISILRAVIAQADDSRPYLPWSGHAVAAVAKKLRI